VRASPTGGRRWRHLALSNRGDDAALLVKISPFLCFFLTSLFFRWVVAVVGADGDDGDEAVGGAVIEATKQRSDGWFPPLKGTHGLRPGDLIAATEKGQDPV
jgi:hypothetical protein